MLKSQYLVSEDLPIHIDLSQILLRIRYPSLHGIVISFQVPQLFQQFHFVRFEEGELLIQSGPLSQQLLAISQETIDVSFEFLDLDVPLVQLRLECVAISVQVTQL